jgi:precorrin-2/cobalt-factor-2 C20-methyltransferase
MGNTDLGTLYGVGLGPGDPELVTVKALRLLRRVPVVIMPQSLNHPGVALSIMNRWVRSKRQRRIIQPYPMTGPEHLLEEARRTVAEQTVRFLRTGADVAFVSEGDPLLYSTFIDLMERVRSALASPRVEIIPAVSSVTACAAAAGEPLAHRAERVAVVSALDGVEDIEQILERFETVVLLKVRNVFDALVDRLDKLDLRAGVLVEECGRPEQRITWDLRARRGHTLSYFSTVILWRAHLSGEVPCNRRSWCRSSEPGRARRT